MVQQCVQGTSTVVACKIAQCRRIGLEHRIFYCWSRELAEKLARALRAVGFSNCRHYHSTSEDKEEATEGWLRNGSFITATRALGTGMDFPGIVYIVHIGVLYRLIDFAQESSQGRRNGEAVDSIILLDDRECQKLEKTDTAAMTTDEFFIQQFIQSKECRQLALGLYLDGKAKTCSNLGRLQCNRCRKGLTDWRQGEVKGAIELRAFEQIIDEVQQHCRFCWVLKGADQAEHQPDQCCNKRKDMSLEASKRLQEMIKVYCKCWVCWQCRVS